jgi:hypothetical protein
MEDTTMAQSVAAPTREQVDAAIRQTVLDYVESWYDGDAARMERSVHPELAKRIVRPAEPPPAPWRPPGDWLDDMGALRLVQLTQQHPTPAHERPPATEVRILDRFENAASVKILDGDDPEYHHVARWNGHWMIVNVLWGLRPMAQPSSLATPVQGQGDVDDAAITSTALDYVESCYDGAGDRMERSLHPDLAKRIVHAGASPSGDRFDKLSALGLVYLIRHYPSEGARRTEVTILDRAENAASVRVDASTWIDYMHIARWNGRWAIVNVLWAVRPRT